MTKWKYTIDIKKEWEECGEEKISTLELTKKVIEELDKYLNIRGEDESLEYIRDNFQGLIDCDIDDKDEFDGILEELYDWADESRVWIKTMFWH